MDGLEGWWLCGDANKQKNAYKDMNRHYNT